MVPQHLKGFDDGVSAWLVLGEEDLGSRFEAARGARLSRFVGRDAELALLSERWQLAGGGEGQIVTITAEPGLGKSRLVETFLQQVETAPHSRFRYQCSPYHVNSALFPAIQELRLACGFTNEDADAAKLDKLEGMLARTGDFADDGAALLANLLGLPGEDRYGQLYSTPEQIKRRTMDTIVERLLQHAAKTPVIALFEDAHWIDPTSVELLQLISDRTREAPLLMLVTHRPEWHFPLAGHDNLTSLKLNRLGKSQAAAIVRATAGDAVPDEIIVRIVARTDGVPLFVEELTKSLIEAGLDASSDDIPASLQASLLARLDRLGPEAKEAAQIGAVIGREFTHALLKDVHEEAAENVDAALDDIVESGLMFRDGLPPDDRYTFKHALVQDTAYGSLLKSRRLELHRKVARALEAAQNEPPELLAHHFTEAGLTEEALHYWLSAGRDAAARCNHREAISHLERGLALLETTPAGPERDRGEIEFRLVLGTPLGGRFGVASGELEANYLRVQELCRSDDETESLFPATWNLWLNSVMRGELRRSCSLADQVLVLGDRRNDVGLQIEAHHAQWTSRFLVGEPGAALEHCRHGDALYQSERHHELTYTYGGHDPGVCAGNVGSFALWMLGHPNEARSRVRASVELARRLQHATTFGDALCMEMFVASFDRDVTLSRARAAEVRKFAETESFQDYESFAKAAQGWVRFEQGDKEAGLPQVRDAMRILVEQGDPWTASLLTVGISVLGRGNRCEEGLELLGEAMRHFDKNQVHWWDAELFRLKGELLLAGEVHDADGAEACFLKACDIARQQQAKSLELRATLSLARLWSERGKNRHAGEILQPIVSWFPASTQLSDLDQANEFLTSLS
jgi:predicted ATPase